MNISDIFFSSSTLLNCISKKYYTNAIKSRFHSFLTEIVYDKIILVIIAYYGQKINVLEVICVKFSVKIIVRKRGCLYGKTR